MQQTTRERPQVSCLGPMPQFPRHPCSFIVPPKAHEVLGCLQAPSVCSELAPLKVIIGMQKETATIQAPLSRAPGWLQALACSLHTVRGPGESPWGTSARGQYHCCLTQAQMHLLVSVSPAQPITLQAGLQSGPCPWQ